MREILFRGKDIRQNWHIGLLAHIGNAWYISNKAGIATAFEVIPETVGEYANLIDKNYKKIFEGDIVITNKFNNPSKKYIVKYNLSFASFIGEDKNEMFFTTFDGDSNDFEVIGNVHDNPELLKE